MSDPTPPVQVADPRAVAAEAAWSEFATRPVRAPRPKRGRGARDSELERLMYLCRSRLDERAPPRVKRHGLRVIVGGGG